MEKKLTAQEQRFVSEYLTDLAPERAALTAGFSASVARTKAYQWVSDSKQNPKPHVLAAIRAGMRKHADRTGITVDRVLAEYAKLAFLDIRKAFDAEGNLLPIHDLDDDTAAAIAGIEVEVRRVADTPADEELEGQPHGGALRRQYGTAARIHKLKLSDKKGALDSLAKHLGMFVDRTEITGKDGAPFEAVKIYLPDNGR